MVNIKDEYLIKITRTSAQARKLMRDGWETVPDGNRLGGFAHGNKQAQVLRKLNPDYVPPKSKAEEKAEKAAAKEEKAAVKAERAEERAQKGPGLVSKGTTAAVGAIRAKLAEKADPAAAPAGQAPAPTPAGWYPDPSGAPNTVRWWDGAHWTDNRHTYEQ